MTPEERRAQLENARALFNRGDYWLAHEAVETIWRSIIKESGEARVWQGLIQAAAALLHRQRGNRHGMVKLGGAALQKLDGPQRADIEFDTVTFRAQLARALAGDEGAARGAAEAPRLEFRVDHGERKTDD